MNLLDLLFPRTCVSCGQLGVYLCPSCVARVPFAETICPSCNRFSFYGKTHDHCYSQNGLDGLICLWEHKGVIRSALSEIKYKFATDILNDVVELSSIEVKKFRVSAQSLCTGVPLHRVRANWRGFNQAEELGKRMSIKMDWHFVPNLLIRTSNTETQVSSLRSKRLRNIRGKIAVNKAIFDEIDKNISLFVVDDVWTTGATIKECARVLKESGVKNVWGLTIGKA